MSIYRKTTRSLLWSGASLVVLMASSTAVSAQASAEDESATPESPSTIVVTGSRVQRDGYNAPTPLTVIGAESLEKTAAPNVADAINQLPSMTSSATSRVGNGATSTGTAGLALLDLRGLGSNRTLVLVDGQRVAPSTQTAAVDINNIPTGLLKRVDVVTGGASAAYGSDAVAGVVNFIIDRKFTGLKLNINGGQTSREDNQGWQVTGSFGTSFADGKGHFVVSGEHEHEDGIDFIDPSKRKWVGYTYLVPTPGYTATNGLPRQSVLSNVNYNNVSQGAVITAIFKGTARTNFFATNATTGVVTFNSTAPLFGTSFGQGGAVQPFVYGTIAGNFMVGGNSWNEANVAAMIPKIDRTNGWATLSYEFSPAITARIEGSYGTTHTVGSAAYQRHTGNLTISATNAFLPQSVRDTAAANGVTSMLVGYSTFDMGRMVNDIERSNYRIVGTLLGELGGGWSWEAYYQHGHTDLDIKLRNTTNNLNLSNALDAVDKGLVTTGTPNGQIVCRSTITNPTNGCLPLNIFGIGVANPAAIAYVKGTAFQNQKITQDVFAASINGEPFNTWAGPVSFATGYEHRKDSVVALGDPISENFTIAPSGWPTTLGGFATGNFKSNAGSITVDEGFAEVVAPLLKDSALGNSAEFNGAVRVTHYSRAGTVTTWKAGLTYEPIEDVRLRVVRSRDIRAANIQELFAAGSSQAVDVVDAQLPTGGVNPVRISQITDGNLTLKPEKADTLGLGVVLKPRFLPGFSASFDYYNIKIKDAIQTLTVNEISTGCAAGNADLCSLISRGTVNGIANMITAIRRTPVNVGTAQVRGFDIDATYQLPLANLVRGADGTISLRFLATRALNYKIGTNEAVGENTAIAVGAVAVPRWRTNTQLGYDSDRFALHLTMRTVSSGVYDVTWKSGVDIDKNYIAGATYFDLGGSVKLWGSDNSRKAELYFKVDNLTDKDPPVAASVASSGAPYNPSLYDGIGRTYRMGVRIRM